MKKCLICYVPEDREEFLGEYELCTPCLNYAKRRFQNISNIYDLCHFLRSTDSILFEIMVDLDIFGETFSKLPSWGSIDQAQLIAKSAKKKDLSNYFSFDTTDPKTPLFLINKNNVWEVVKL